MKKLRVKGLDDGLSAVITSCNSDDTYDVRLICLGDVYLKRLHYYNIEVI